MHVAKASVSDTVSFFGLGWKSEMETKRLGILNNNNGMSQYEAKSSHNLLGDSE